LGRELPLGLPAVAIAFMPPWAVDASLNCLYTVWLWKLSTVIV
jgi:hypothetical protein